MEEFNELLRLEFGPYGSLTDLQVSQLKRHYDLLCQWNQKINLTRIVDLKESVRLNYCESLFLAQALPPGPLRIIDVGSGAGFPGIPVAVFRPECAVDLVESHLRKAAFLREATLELPNVKVIVARAGECAQDYDWVISRAVGTDQVRKLGLAPNSALLTSGSKGIKLPWGRERRLVLTRST